MDAREIIIKINGGYVEFYFKNSNNPFYDMPVDMFENYKDMTVIFLKEKLWYRDDVAEQLRELLKEHGITI